MPGLDPGIHAITLQRDEALTEWIWVKPGNDEL
jgi:hypothetical protein